MSGAAARARQAIIASIVAWSVALPVGSCGGRTPPVAVQVPLEAGADSRIGIDDVFEVRVFGEPELSGVYRVSSDGNIDFPMVGRVPVIGLTSTQIQESLTGKLKDGYIRNPHVAVFIKEWNSRRVSVLGQVRNPGYVDYRANMTIVDAIVAAGGFSPIADKNNVKLRQEGDGKTVTTSVLRVGDMAEGRVTPVRVYPRDVVIVEERLF